MKTLIRAATVVNEGERFQADLTIEGPFIDRIERQGMGSPKVDREVDAEGLYLIPGVIDDQVHFREPGLTHKEDIHNASKAAVAGGVTSFMEMPNTVPNTLTQELLEQKYNIAAEKSLANYSFYMGASNNNLDEVLRTDPSSVCGIKAFLGSSTGNMLVDDENTLQRLFGQCHMLLAVHCEDEARIRQQLEAAIAKWGDDIPIEEHPRIRDEEACFLSSSKAVGMARELGTRLHVLHISTARELDLFDRGPVSNKRVTAEACIHHLWFNDSAYKEKGALVKWNPAIKTEEDRRSVLTAVLDDRIDVIATDHAPHTLEEKGRPYRSCPSGAPMVQHSVPVMFELAHRGEITIERVVQKMCHAPAALFNVRDRGYVREGCFADLALVDDRSMWRVERDGLFYKCGWSPLIGQELHAQVTHTWVNGHLAFVNGRHDESVLGQRLSFVQP